MPIFGAPANGITIGGIEVVIADDSVGLVALPSSAGFVAVIRSNPANANFTGFFAYDNDNLVTLSVGVASVVTNLDAATLTGTTGPDGDMVLAVNDGNLAIENRTGASRTFKVMFLG